MSKPTPIKGRCGVCDWPTNSLPCVYCAVEAREKRRCNCLVALRGRGVHAIGCPADYESGDDE